MIVGRDLCGGALWAAVTLCCSLAVASPAEFPAAAAKNTGNGECALVKYGSRVTASRMFEVDPGQAYLLEGEFRASGPTVLSFGLEFFDADKKMLHAFMFSGVPGTETELAAPAKKGDTVLKVRDGSRWRHRQLDHYNLAVPRIDPVEYGISRGELALAIRKIVTNSHRRDAEIELHKGVPCDLPAGTVVSRHCGMPPFNAVWRRPIPGGRWLRFRRLIRAGEGFSRECENFWPGTRYARFFVMASKGAEVRFRNLKCVPVSGAALKSYDRAQRSSGLRLLPFKKCRARLDGDGSVVYDCPSQAGLRYAPAAVPTERAVQFEALVSADSPGMIALDCYGERSSGKGRFQVTKGAPVIPDGKPHWVIFRPEWRPDDRGTIDRVEFTWRNYNSTHLKVERFRILDGGNLVPGAEELPRHKPLELTYVVGGRKHFLRWKDGRCPGVRIEWIDRDGKALGTTELAPDARVAEFTPPEQTVKGLLTVRPGGSGHPELREAPSASPAWRGHWLWITDKEGPEHTTVWFEREIELPVGLPVDDAALATAADDHVDIFINDRHVGEGGRHFQSRRTDVAAFLKPGRNRLTLKVRNDRSFGGVICDLYVRSAGEERFFCTDRDWRFAVGKRKPAVIDRVPVLRGDGKNSHWSGWSDCRRIGVRPALELTGTGRNFFTAKLVHGMVPELPPYLQYSITSKSGDRRSLQLYTKVSNDGREYRFEYAPPRLTGAESGTLRLDEDRLMLRGDPALGEFSPPAAKPGLAQARFVMEGGRPKLELGDRRREVFFWAFPARFQYVYASRPEWIDAAIRGGFDNYALVIDFLEFWKGPEEFDFTNLDRKVEQLLSMKPDAVFMLQIGCYMPDWWLEHNPDDVTVRENGKPRHPTQERQALASKKWLRDSRVPLKALVDHVRNSSWGDRVWGANVAENTNWEWFWWTGRGEKFYVSGYSPADYASFRSFLRKKYATDAELAGAWGQPGVTFDTAKMPTLLYQLRGTVGALLDAEKDRSLIDWFEFRNQVIAEAVIDLCKSLKEFSDGKWLTGAYYGYYVNQCTNVGSHSIHSAGHNGFWEAANSPYVDYIRAPSIYRLRRLGLPEGNQAPQDTFLLHGKVVYIECDMRTFAKEDPRNSDMRISRPATAEQTLAEMDRMFGMMCATGCSYYWYDITYGAYLHPVLTEQLKKQREIYSSLPPVKGFTPVEIAVAGDRDSVYYTKHNNTTDSLLPAIAVPLVEEFPRIGAPFRMLSNADLLEEKTPEHRFYVMYTSFMLSSEQRAALLKRFEKERASVLWIYAPGAFYPDKGPKAEYCADFLGVKMRMDERKRRPRVKTTKEWGGAVGVSSRTLSPWFMPVSGYDEVLGVDDYGEPVLVCVRRNGATHYISTLTNLPVETLREMAKRSGVHLYTPDTRDPAWIGNDLVFIHTATDGTKRITAPRGRKLKRLVGDLDKDLLNSDEEWRGEAGRTYGFLVVEE